MDLPLTQSVWTPSIIFFLLVTLRTVHLSGWNFMHHSFSQCPSLSRSFCTQTAALWYHRKISQVDTKLACKQKTICSNWWIYLWRSQCGLRSSSRLRPRSRALPLLHKRPPIKTNINSMGFSGFYAESQEFYLLCWSSFRIVRLHSICKIVCPLDFGVYIKLLKLHKYDGMMWMMVYLVHLSCSPNTSSCSAKRSVVWVLSRSIKVSVS
jgi:hypothetical protein